MKRWGHPQGDTGIPELSYRHHEKLTMVRNRHPATIYYPPVCNKCFAFVKSDCRYPCQLICKWCSPNMAIFCGLWTEKFVHEVAYRETRPPFWHALISRYGHPKANGDVSESQILFMATTGDVWIILSLRIWDYVRATCCAHFMWRRELWPASVSHPFSSLNCGSLGFAGEKQYQKITVHIFDLFFKIIPGYFPYILFYRYLFSLLLQVGLLLQYVALFPSGN